MPQALTARVLQADFGTAAPLTQQWLPVLRALQPANSASYLAERTYYALIIKLLIAQYILGDYQATMPELESGQAFQQAQVLNFPLPNVFTWYLDHLADLTPLLANIKAQLSEYIFHFPPPDALKSLYQDLLPNAARHEHGEYYTPDWLALHILKQVGDWEQGRLLDPACGSGTFLALALQQTQHPQLAVQRLAGIDSNPLAVLAARANLLLQIGRPTTPLELPIYLADTLLQPPKLGIFEQIVGNPPWVNWETLSPDYRHQTAPLWEKYGLFIHQGMARILGNSKKELALLMTYAVADTYLAEGGTLRFIMPQNTLKSGAGAGLRRWQLGGTSLGVLQVEDLTAIEAFELSYGLGIVLTMRKGDTTCYPVPYIHWQRQRRKQPKNDDSLAAVLQKTTRTLHYAEPIQPSDPTSVWVSGSAGTLAALRHLRGVSAYTAHAGAYTGGANGVYWLEVLETLSDGLLRVRNIVDEAKYPVPQVEAVLESALVYPLLRGRDVQRWHAQPSLHILMVQHPTQRRGYDLAWLQAHYPLTYAYLIQFEDILRQRAAFKRYFRPSVPFYTMFDIGEYTFAPVKVIWCGMGLREMHAAVVTHHEKPIIPNQALHPFISLTDETEAHFLAACLNSAPFENAVLSHTTTRGKSFAQAGILRVLRLPTYDPQNALHQDLAALSQQAHQRGITTELTTQINNATADLWGLSRADLVAILGK